MTARFGIATEDGDLIYIGPASGFASKVEALVFLICVPCDEAVNWHIVALDGDALPAPSPFTPPQPRMES